MSQNRKFPFILILGGLLLIVGALAWFLLFNNTQAVQDTSTELVFISGPYPEIPRLSLVDAKNVHENKGAVFLDVRGDEAYTISHIPGAVSIDEDELKLRLNELSPANWIITYCS